MKKSRLSSVTTWMLRLLLVAIILLGAGLIMLSNLAGTSEQHRRGLEQAFSDTLRADVTIQKIDEFKILPQLSIKAQGLRAVLRNSENEFMADKVDIGFGLFDLALGRRRIENFRLENFRFSANSEYDLKIEKSSIDDTKPSLLIEGVFEAQKFNFIIYLQKTESNPASYYFAEENIFTGKYGALDVQGILRTDRPYDVIVINIILDGQIMAQGKGGKKEGRFNIWFDCRNGSDLAFKQNVQTLKPIPTVIIGESCKL